MLGLHPLPIFYFTMKASDPCQNNIKSFNPCAGAHSAHVHWIWRLAESSAWLGPEQHTGTSNVWGIANWLFYKSSLSPAQINRHKNAWSKQNLHWIAMQWAFISWFRLVQVYLPLVCESVCDSRLLDCADWKYTSLKALFQVEKLGFERLSKFV